MQQGWVIDVLADLKSFARQNGLPVLAEQLDDTILVAAAELAKTSGLAELEREHGGQDRTIRNTIAAGDNA
ncbi:hypothetical protein [Qingshengfaniella alkalisoli]|uniref:Uncharacterized protein n=1 Tax=Qingshengfaniella alkalisoli TaxID=2599296 RepID=A0A5B8I598_9RHOB|nr:hypothetical protein [Qingshengfaniella alkalisoli]QDY68405.1 hypothetical protein FPZ52_01400 [Qingshengfaniella alkalisoli]